MGKYDVHHQCLRRNLKNVDFSARRLLTTENDMFVMSGKRGGRIISRIGFFISFVRSSLVCSSHFFLRFPVVPVWVSRQSLKITSTVSMQLRAMNYHTIPCNIIQYQFYKAYRCPTQIPVLQMQRFYQIIRAGFQTLFHNFCLGYKVPTLKKCTKLMDWLEVVLIYVVGFSD